jgi:hypothetical protein
MAITATVYDRNRAQFQQLFSDMWLVSATLDPASVAAEASGTDTITVPGVQLGDMVLGVSLGVTINSNLVVQAFVSAANTVTLMFTNNNVAAGAAIDVASATVRLLVVRPVNSGQAS